MNLYVNSDTGRFQQGAGTTLPLGDTLVLMRGDNVFIDVYFVRSGGSNSFDLGNVVTMTLGIKPQGSFDNTSYLAVSDSFTKLNEDNDTFYRFELNLNTEQLGTFLGKDNNNVNDLDSAIANIEITRTVTDSVGTSVTTTPRQIATIQNDINRGDEGVPTDSTPEYMTVTGAITLFNNSIPKSAIESTVGVGGTNKVSDAERVKGLENEFEEISGRLYTSLGNNSKSNSDLSTSYPDNVLSIFAVGLASRGFPTSSGVVYTDRRVRNNLTSQIYTYQRFLATSGKVYRRQSLFNGSWTSWELVITVDEDGDVLEDINFTGAVTTEDQDLSNDNSIVNVGMLNSRIVASGGLSLLDSVTEMDVSFAGKSTDSIKDYNSTASNFGNPDSEAMKDVANGFLVAPESIVRSISNNTGRTPGLNLLNDDVVFKSVYPPAFTMRASYKLSAFTSFSEWMVRFNTANTVGLNQIIDFGWQSLGGNNIPRNGVCIRLQSLESSQDMDIKIVNSNGSSEFFSEQGDSVTDTNSVLNSRFFVGLIQMEQRAGETIFRIYTDGNRTLRAEVTVDVGSSWYHTPFMRMKKDNTLSSTFGVVSLIAFKKYRIRN